MVNQPLPINEAEYRAPNGKLIAPIPGSEKTRITPDNARDMVKKRQEKYRLAALRRIVDEAKSVDPTVSTSADAFGLVASKQFVTLLDSEKPRINDLVKLGELMTGAVGTESQRSHEPQNGEIRLEVSTLLELATQLEAHMAKARDAARSIEAETIQPAE